MEKLVIKIGTSSLTDRKGLDQQLINNIARQVSYLQKDGIGVAIVTSGAVASGKNALKNNNGPEVTKQVLAAVGQRPLLNAWGSAFDQYGINTGLFLFSEEDLSKPRLPLLESLGNNIVPIINANDTVSLDEIRKLAVSADNDRLASFAARFLIGANKLILLTDAEGVLDIDGKVVKSIQSLTDLDKISIFGKSKVGTGGMNSKINEARAFITDSSKTAYIAGARIKDVILRVVKGETVGTRITLPIQVFFLL